MRKYFKLWLHRERTVREAAARRIQALFRGRRVRERYRLKLPSSVKFYGRQSTAAATAAAVATSKMAHETAAAAVALCERQALEIADLKRQVDTASQPLRSDL